MKKASIIFTVFEIVSGVLSAIALAGNLVVDFKESKEIGCDENVDTQK